MNSSETRGRPGSGPAARPLGAGDPVEVGGRRLLGRLGEGGMGVVYLGLDPSERKVAIKVISPALARDPVFRARFDAEAANARRVAPFCTARVLDHGEADGLAYLVTEYIDGPSLTDRVAARGPLPPDELHGLAAGVAAALTAIHAVHLVHRDLKPGNVLLAADSPRVIDFGVARALDAQSHHTQTGAVIGSPGYLAPEQAFGGEVGTAADVFAWGTLVAFAATGRNPFGVGTLTALAVRAREGAYDLSGVPADLSPLLRAALDPDPARRPTAEELLVRLVGDQDTRTAAVDFLDRHWFPAPRPPETDPASPGRRAASRRRWTWIAVGAAVLATGGATGAVVHFADSGGGRVPSEPSRSATGTAAAERWHEIGGLDRLSTYCEESGKSVTYTGGGRDWWCRDDTGNLQAIDLEAACRWHYPSYKSVRVQQRPDPGPLYEVHWYCEALS